MDHQDGLHILCQLIQKEKRTSMIYVGTKNSLVEIFPHQGGEPNLFYTVAAIRRDVIPDRIGIPWKPQIKDFAFTDFLAYDIDGIDPTVDINEVEMVCERWVKQSCEENKYLFTDSDDRHYVASGHGLHALFRIPRQTTIEFFQKHLEQYRQSCVLLHRALELAHITCKQVDPTIFEPSRLLRVPGTINIKEGKEPVPCRWMESLGEGKDAIRRV